MKLLLDTHTVIWTMNGSHLLGSNAREVIVDFNNKVYVSVVNVWEAATKYRLGKFPEAAEFLSDPALAFSNMSFTSLTLGIEEARFGGSMPSPHRDPFDRMLAAQAILGGLVMVSRDAIFDGMMVPRIW